MIEDEMITNISEKHIADTDVKLSIFGYGEWIEEIDEMDFSYKNYVCAIKRNTSGNLCGYVALCKEHPYFSKNYDEMEIECHGNLTYGEKTHSKIFIQYWVGFDCGHVFDLIPVIKSTKEIFSMRNGFPPSELFNGTYKNMNFCIEQCKSIVNQLIVIENAEKLNQLMNQDLTNSLEKYDG